MKLLSLLSFAALAAALPKASTASSSSISGSTSSVPAPSPSGSASASFVGTSGTQFTIDNKKGYYAGSNSYWIGFLTNNDDVDLVFQRMSESGLKILRVWGFNDVNSIPGDDTVWFQYHANGASQINTGANGLQRLDYVVSSAEKHGIKLIINFVNNWSDYGGMEAYTSAYGGDQKGWYTNTKIQAAYQKYIKAVVSRYTKSTAVFAWELANEPRCNGCDTDVLYNWIAKTSKYIKSLDANHLVAIGDEGFGLDIQSDGSYPYTYSEGLNFTKNLGIKDIDFGTFHLYPSSWGVPNSFGNGWVTSHGAACAAAGKPCLFEEYGVTSDHCNLESPWQKTALHATGVSADLYWQYGDTLSTGKSPDDGNTIYYGTSDFECLVTEHVKSI